MLKSTGMFDDFFRYRDENPGGIAYVPPGYQDLSEAPVTFGISPKVW
jgi:hypothetical protein